MTPDLRSLMRDLSLLLDLSVDTLEERKEFPVGTERAWSSGTYKKSKSGWVRVSRQAQPDKVTKPESLPLPSPEPEPADVASNRSEPQDTSKGTQEWSEQIVSPTVLKRAQENIPKYEQIGLTKDEAIYASTVVASWADKVYMPGAASLRGAVSSALGIQLADEQDILNIVAERGRAELPLIESSMRAMGHAYNGEAPPPPDVVKKSIAKISKASQDAYDEDPVTLYRGVGYKSALVAMKSGKLAVASLTSWSESEKVAAMFTGSGGKVMKVKVPKASIVLSHRTCPGLLETEKEVVLAVKGAIKCEVLDMKESRNSELRRPV